MPITASTLYRDSYNFLRNQLGSVLLISLLSAFIAVILNHAFAPDSDQLSLLTASINDLDQTSGISMFQAMQQMTPDQQMLILKKSASGTFSSLVGNVLLIGGILTLIRLVSQGTRTSALRCVGLSAPVLPKLVLLMIIISFLTSFGFMLLIVPGVILIIILSLSPVIAVSDNIGIFRSMKMSAKLAFANARLLVPAIMLWIAAEILVGVAVRHLQFLAPEAADVVLNTLSNFISAFLLIYLYRLYSKLRG